MINIKGGDHIGWGETKFPVISPILILLLGQKNLETQRYEFG